MNILITGGAGFIGSHVAEHYCHKHKVTVFDNLSTGSAPDTNFKYRFILGDITSAGDLMNLFFDTEYDVVINLAAQVSVNDSVKWPRVTEDTNTHGTIMLADYAGRNGVKVFVQASSAAVYGHGKLNQPMRREDELPCPLSPYAMSKLSGEYYNRYFASKHGYIPINLRFFNVYGPGQRINSGYSAVIPTFIDCVKNNKPLTVYGDGGQTRDFIYVDDVVSAIDRTVACALEDDLYDHTFNVGTGEKTSVNQLVEMIAGETFLTLKPRRDAEVRHSLADCQILKLHGWTPKYSIEDGLKKTIEFYNKSN